MIALIHTLLFVSYLVFIGIKFKKVPSSISETYYLLGENMIFTVWMMAMGVVGCMYPSVWLFLSGASLCFTAVAAQYKNKITNVVHYVGALGGYLFACVEINPFLTGAALIITFLIRKIDNRIYWTEVIVFFIIVGGLFLRFRETF